MSRRTIMAYTRYITDSLATPAGTAVHPQEMYTSVIPAISVMITIPVINIYQVVKPQNSIRAVFKYKVFS